jgi:hypothetical protein
MRNLKSRQASNAAYASFVLNSETNTLRRLRMVYLQINLQVAATDRPAATGVYTKYKAAFLAQAKGAQSKALLIRDEDVQVMHGFDSIENAQAYLGSNLFNQDVVTALKPLLQGAPDVRIYEIA